MCNLFFCFGGTFFFFKEIVIDPIQNGLFCPLYLLPSLKNTVIQRGVFMGLNTEQASEHCNDYPYGSSVRQESISSLP